MQMDVQAGVGYGIVVDGFAGNFGTFEITVSATKVRSWLAHCHVFLTGLWLHPPTTLQQKWHGALGWAVIMRTGADSCPALPRFGGSY